ncbi:MAG: PAAR-like domain-containing protein [Pseudomonadota bacterium]
MPNVNSQGPLPALDISSIDLYWLTTPAGPVLMVLMSIGMRASEVPTCFRVLIMCMPSHNAMNQTPVTVSGPGPGALSGMVCSASGNLSFSTKLFIEYFPGTRGLMDMTKQNGPTMNSVGNTPIPSQIRFYNPSR